jgi:cysteine desulfurase family protein (TIGR01976 family)
MGISGHSGHPFSVARPIMHPNPTAAGPRRPDRPSETAAIHRGVGDDEPGPVTHAVPVTSYDLAALRAQFPALAEGAAHFDGPGGSQVPTPVGQAVARTLTSAIANRGRATAAERRADQIVLDARAALGDLLGTDPRGVVFGRSMTQLTYDIARTLGKTWHPGDEIVVTRLDHDANIRPWVQAAENAGASVRWADFNPQTTELTLAHIDAVLTDRTRLVALTAASNLVGTRPPVAEIAALVHRTGALLYVDGVHFTAHASVDMSALGADFFACSPYKLLGPHCGVLAAAPGLLQQLHPDKLLPSSDAIPERFELGTLPYELLAGCTAAVDFVATLAPPRQPKQPEPQEQSEPAEQPEPQDRRSALVAAMQAVEAHEHRLQVRLEAALSAMPDVVLHSRAAERTPTLLLSFTGSPAGDVQQFLAERGVNAPAGSFYALEASRRLGLGDGGALRIGLAPYTDDSDVDRLLTAVTDFLKQR